MKLYSSNKSYKLYQGNMLDMLDVIEENSIDSIVCDPPYELNFMNKSWDNTGIAFQKETWKKCLKVLKPGGHLLAFAGSKGQHRMACAIEDAGFEIRDTIMWLYGCYSSDTQVLTDKGWRYFYDLDKTEKVLQYNKNTNELSWVKPLNYFEYDIDDNMQIFKTENSEQFITCNHSVLYKTKNINNITQTNNANFVMLATIIYKDVYLPIYKDNNIIWEKIIDTKEVDYKGKVYCLRTETGAFVVRRNIQAFISGNSGFPKSLNIGLAIDKRGGVQSKVIGTRNYTVPNSKDLYNVSIDAQNERVRPLIKEAQNEFKGWGTQLKPSYEPIIVARKPVENSIVDNVIKYGVGGINIDECRVSNTSADSYDLEQRQVSKATGSDDDGHFLDQLHNQDAKYGVTEQGRFPANTILTYDDSDFDEVCGGFPYTKTGSRKAQPQKEGSWNAVGIKFKMTYACEGSEGSASRYFKNCKYTEDDFYDIPQRYFYSAKASKQDRDEGLDSFIEQENKVTNQYNMLRDDGTIREVPLRKNTHPTVKPCELLRYLVRLVTPKGGIILDCFNGSGSTGKAVMIENKEHNKNYKYIGIEMTEEYLPISKARIEYYCDKDITENIIAEKISEEKQKPKQTEKQNKKSSNQICMFD